MTTHCHGNYPILTMKNFISTSEAAAILGIDKVTVAKWCRIGELAAQRIGRDWLVESPIVRRGLVKPVGRPPADRAPVIRPKKKKKTVRA